MANVTASFETHADRKSGLVRKMLGGAVLLGKYSAAPVITTLVATSNQIIVPDSYDSAGWMSKDGVTFGQSREFSEVPAYGTTVMLRRDVTSEDLTMQFTMLETNRLALEVRHNQDLSATQMSAAGELKIDRPAGLAPMTWRGFYLGRDGSGASTFYMARTFNRLTVTEVGDQVASDGDDPLMTPVTVSAEVDEVSGLVGSEFLFGPGALAAAVAMGFTVAS